MHDRTLYHGGHELAIGAKELRLLEDGAALPIDRKVGGADATAQAGMLADAGKPISESFVISFEDPADMLAVLTPARLALFRVIKQEPGSIASIAQKMNRDRGAVTRDVAALIPEWHSRAHSAIRIDIIRHACSATETGGR